MSAEQMRMELESFVNQGLQEGRRGWPMKGQLSGRKEVSGARCLVPATEMALGHFRTSRVASERIHLLLGGSPEGGSRPLNGARTLPFDENRLFLCDFCQDLRLVGQK